VSETNSEPVIDDRADASQPSARTRRAILWHAFVRLAEAVRLADPTEVEKAIRQFGETRRWLTPLAYIAGGFALLFDGLKLLVLNWRLTLIEIVPAIWIWFTTWNIKVHFLKGRELNIVRGPVALALAVAVILITIAAYWCNAIFAFTVIGPRPPRIRPAVVQVKRHLPLILGWGVAVGFAHAVATIYVARLGVGWFTLALGAVLAVMTITFISVPADLIGARLKPPLKEKLTGVAASGAMSAVLTSPGFLLNRIGLLLLGVSVLRIPAMIIFSVGVALQAAATSGASAVKLGSRLAKAPGDATEPASEAGRPAS
jgi:hypothetical protein